MKRPAKIEPPKRARVPRKQRATPKRGRASLDAKVRKPQKKRAGSVRAGRRPAEKSRRKKTPTAATKRSSKKEDLPAKIFAALDEAGQAGVGLPALAAELGAQSGALYAGFQAAMKRHPGIKKIEIQASVEARRAMPIEQPNMPLRVRIQETLRAAGPNGLSLQELAAQLGVNYKHVAAWFATTGKKLSSIQKVAATTYRFAVP